MHIAGHTFGDISGEKIPIQMLQEIYTLSSSYTTIGYHIRLISFTWMRVLRLILL